MAELGGKRLKSSRSNLILRCILIYTALSFYEPFWRLTMRAPMQGQRFSWDYAGLGGQGATGGYGIVVLITLIGLIILTLGWRAPNRFFRWSVLVWALLLFLSSLAIVVSDPGIVITAETLRLEVPYAWFVFPLDFLYAAITFIWFLRERRNLRQRPLQKPERPEWTRINTAFLIVAVLFIPMEYVLFNAGELHGTTDQAAVALTFIQYICINLSLIPWNPKSVKVSESKQAVHN
jgi:hypothetical protein